MPAGEGQAGRVTVYRRREGALKCSFLLPYMTAVPSSRAKSSGFVVGQNWLEFWLSGPWVLHLENGHVIVPAWME